MQQYKSFRASRHNRSYDAVLRVALLKIQVLWDVALRRWTSILKDCSKESLTLKT